MENIMLWVWLGVFIFTLILEAMTQELISIWFTLGALVALPFSFLDKFYYSIIVFCVVSVVTLIFTRPILKRIVGNSIRKTNADDFIGKRVKTIKKITKFEAGDVKINGIKYDAILMDDVDTDIEVDSLVEIVSIKGNKVIVKKIEEE